MLTYPPVKKVSVVIPVYNEQDSLPELLRRTDAACATLGRQYEILLIDDGSSDDSARMLTEAAEAEGSHVVAVLLNRNYGQHSAIMAGFSHVTGDLIITLDADLQNPPEEIPRLVAKADEGYDVVGTVRQNRQDSIFRKTASKMINRLIQRSQAHLVTCAQDVLKLMEWDADARKKQSAQPSLFTALLPEEQVLVDLIRTQGKIDIDSLITHVMPVEKINDAFDLMHKYGLFYGTSTCYTRANVERVSSDEFMDL